MNSTFFGMNIVESPLVQPQPVLRIREAVPCTQSVRDEINAWFLREFGAREVVYVISPTSIFGSNTKTIFASPRTMAQIRNLAPTIAAMSASKSASTMARAIRPATP